MLRQEGVTPPSTYFYSKSMTTSSASSITLKDGNAENNIWKAWTTKVKIFVTALDSAQSSFVPSLAIDASLSFLLVKVPIFSVLVLRALAVSRQDRTCVVASK